MKFHWLENSAWRPFSPYLFALACFVGLGLFGFPQPMIDDLFFTGAGLNLAQGGDFSNAMLARQHFPGTLYFVQPPLHSYVLAGWLKMFGISTFSMVAFQLVADVFICWAVIRILRQYQAPRLLECLVPLGVATAFLSLGLRSEPLSVALTMAGFAILECCCGRAITLFSGFILMFLGASVASRLGVFSGMLALVAFVRLWQGGISIIRLGLLAGAALLVAVLVFLGLIGFQFREFYETYHFHAAGRIGGDTVGLLIRFLTRMLGVTQWPLLIIWGLTFPLMFSLRSSEKDAVRISLFILISFAALAFMGALGHGAIWYAVFMVFILTAAHARRAAPMRSWTLQLLLAAALLMGNSRNFVAMIGLMTGQIVTDKGILPTAESISPPTPERPLLIDSAAARYVFDYRLPRGVLDWSFAAPFPGELATEVALQPGDLYLLGSTSFDTLGQKLGLEMAAPRWTPLGLARWSFHKYPQRTYAINATDCIKPVLLDHVNNRLEARSKSAMGSP